MNRKRNIETEKALRRLDAKKKRLERVMSGYIYHTHPEIYAEGVKFYNALDAVYPNKKDLRKTLQFMALQDTTPHHKTVEKSKVQQVTEKKKIVKDNFVLEIPLAKRKTIVQQTSTITRAMGTLATTSATETAATTSATETTATTKAPETTADIPVLAELTPSGTTDLLPVDDATLQQIFEELKNDTCLYQFFNDMDFDMCDQDDDIY